MATQLQSMTPVEYGEYLASLEPPISDEQAEAAARVLLASEPHARSA